MIERIIRNVIAISAITFLASCNIETDIAESYQKITVTTVDDNTKAGYEGTFDLPSEFIMDIHQGKDDVHDYSLLRMVRKDGGNTYENAGDEVLLWADEDRSNVKVKAMTVPYGLSSIDDEDSICISVCEDQTTEENVRKSDVLAAETGNGITIEGNDIVIDFNHIMSKLWISYSFNENIAADKAKVISIILENTCIKGGYSYKDMRFDNEVPVEFGDVELYLDSNEKTAEAIFYPHVQTETSYLVITASIDGIIKEFRYPISYAKPEGFLGGKRYKKTVEISMDDAEDPYIPELENRKILWIGTSIPKGSEDNNYPAMVAEAIGCKVTNNAKGASFITFDPTQPSWTTPDEVSSKYSEGLSLTASIDDIESKYTTVLNEMVKNGDMPDYQMNAWLRIFREHSYENLIIPYIDGSKESCDIIIIDHGYNDQKKIVSECSNYPNPDGSLPKGLYWLNSIASGQENYVDRYDLKRNSYFGAMEFIIEECRKINPDIKIIIGNYFSSRGLSFSWDFTKEQGGVKCCGLVIAANEAVASKWGLDIVNVYEYTGLDNETDFTDFLAFCPDYFHPHSDNTGRSNEIIASVYIKELKRIFKEK